MSMYSSLKHLWMLVPRSLRSSASNSPVLGQAIQALRRVTATHNDLYSAEYFEYLDTVAATSAEAIAGSVVRDLAPGTALDVGCGTGAVLVALRRRGVHVAGLEYADAAIGMCRGRNLDVKKFNLEADDLSAHGEQFDVVISTEVAEHLDARFADRYVDLLAQSAPLVVFTAATPGQGGTDHVNEQPHSYWIDKFGHRGFQLDAEISQRWRKEWKAGGTAVWYYSNAMVFRRGA
jgi:cyclopropane fatty-acyl-phospholipid synthase-like methyltransferase